MKAVGVLSVVISVLIVDFSSSRKGSSTPARIHKTHHISIHQDIILTSIEDLKGLFVKLLDEYRTLWGEREQAAQWFGNVAEFEQGQNRCCQHHMKGKQRVATAVFSQHIGTASFVLF